MSALQKLPAEVAAAFDGFAPKDKAVLMEVRMLIFEVARDDARVGVLEEALRWGDPAYLTQKRKTGSTIRLGVEKTSGAPAMFFNCKSTLVQEFRQLFEGTLTFSKNRAVLLGALDETTRDVLKLCILSALTYHLRK